MKKQILFILVSLMLIVLTVACNNSETNEVVNEKDEVVNEKNEQETKANLEEDKTITFGVTTWTSTEAPTNIAKLILEEAGYDVEFALLDQPIIFKGLAEQEVDFFMDAWLPYTEEQLWAKYEDDLQKVATSYKDVPLGWVVPSYVEENTIEELIGNAEKFDNRVVTIAPGAGIVSLSQDVIDDYQLDDYELLTSSEIAMIAELENKLEKKEPIIITGWRPHSMFAKYDLKFLEDTKGHFKPDNVHVISYKGIEESHPTAYNILSKWSIDVADLEAMMHANEVNETTFEELAKQWIEENREKVDSMLEK